MQAQDSSEMLSNAKVFQKDGILDISLQRNKIILKQLYQYGAISPLLALTE